MAICDAIKNYKMRQNIFTEINFAQQSGMDRGVHGGFISRADWFALAGIAAVDFTLDRYEPGRIVSMSWMG